MQNKFLGRYHLFHIFAENEQKMSAKYAINLPVPKGWQTFREELEEDGQPLQSFEACAPGKDQDDIVPCLQIIVGPMPAGSNSKQSAIDTFMDILGLEEDREYDEERDHDVQTRPFRNGECHYFDAMSDDGQVVMRNIFTEILPDTLLMAVISDKNDNGLEVLCELIENKLEVRLK